MESLIVEKSVVDEKIETEIQSLFQKRGMWESDRRLLNPIINDIVKLGGDASIYSSGVYLSVSGGRDILTKAMRILRAAGCKLVGDRPKDGETTWTGLYELDGIQSKYVSIYFTSTSCRRVQVGTEMKETPVYEIQCDDKEALF